MLTTSRDNTLRVYDGSLHQKAVISHNNNTGLGANSCHHEPKRFLMPVAITCIQCDACCDDADGGSDCDLAGRWVMPFRASFGPGGVCVCGSMKRAVRSHFNSTIPCTVDLRVLLRLFRSVHSFVV